MTAHRNTARPIPAPRPLPDMETWVFDLDNTLYPASSDVFPQIDKRMKAFIADYLKLPLDEAFLIQKKYYHQYGTTLRGLMLENKLEPSLFLDYVHDIDHSVLEANPALDAALADLDGRKIIFTNGSERHAERVLDRLGIARHFESIFDIAAADFIPKPQPETYTTFIKRHAFDPRAAAMLEDSPANLVPALAVGMTTVLVRECEPYMCASGHGPDPKTEDLSHCHHVVEDLVDWLKGI